MCFYTKGSKIRIAFKDIECYKLMSKKDDCYVSVITDFTYKCNQIYSGKSKWKLFLKWLFNFIVTNEAYHSNVYKWNYSWHYESVKCVIPKGSLYLVNELNGEYCSSSIIIKKTEL